MVVFGGEAKHVNGGVDNNLKKPIIETKGKERTFLQFS